MSEICINNDIGDISFNLIKMLVGQVAMTMFAKSKQERGFTLIELLVTLAVMVIVLGVGIPFFGSVMANNRALTDGNDFVTSINLARSQAIASGRVVSWGLCNSSSDTKTVCGYQASTEDSAASGWLVFIDTDSDGSCDSCGQSGGDEPVKVWADVSNGLALSFSDSGISNIRFMPTGQTLTSDEFSIELANKDSEDEVSTTGKTVRCYAFSALGQMTMTKASGSCGFAANNGNGNGNG